MTNNPLADPRTCVDLSTFLLLSTQMSPLLNVSVDNLMELFKERCEKGEAFNIHA